MYIMYSVRKLKLLTSLSTLTLVGTSVPIVSTSCADQYNFDGVYSSEDVLGYDPYSAQNAWIKKYFLYNDQPWSDPKDPFMDDSYDDPQAIAYLKQNMHSVRQYVGSLIYSMMLRFFEIMEAEKAAGEQILADPVQIKIYDSDFVFDSTTNAFTMAFSLDVLYKNNQWYHVAKIRTKTGKKLSILRVCKFGDDLDAMWIGYTYDPESLSIDFGLEVDIYDETTNLWSGWQDLTVLNANTQNFIDGITNLYIPIDIAHDAIFKDSNPQLWLYESNSTSYDNPIIPVPFGSEDTSKSTIDFTSADFNKIKLFKILLNINGIATLLTNQQVKVETNPVDTTGQLIYDASASTLALLPQSGLTTSPIELLLTLQYGETLGMEDDQKFIVKLAS